MPTEMFGVPGISSGSQSAVLGLQFGSKYGLAIGPYFTSAAGGQNHGPYIQRPNELMPLGSPGFWAGMYTWWYQRLPRPPHLALSQVGSWLASCSSPGTNVRSWITSGIPSPRSAK